MRGASHRAFVQGSQVGADALIKDASQVVKHGGPSRWQRAEQEKATASMFPGRELVAQDRVHTSQKSLDFLGQLLSTEKKAREADLECWEMVGTLHSGFFPHKTGITVLQKIM